MIDRRLKVRHLQAFVEIAHQKSLKRAAEVLSLTQPAISKTLKELEEIAGVTLLERSRSGVMMTAEGEVFLKHAANSLSELDQAMNSVSALHMGQQGSLAIGALPSVAARLLPPAIRIFEQDFPDVTPRIEDGPHGYLVDCLHARSLDLVIGRLGEPDTMSGLSFAQLYVEDAVVVCAPEHPLYKTKHLARNLTELASHQIIYPTAESAIRPLVDRAMIANGINEFPNRIESVSATFGRSLTLAGTALWIISSGVVAADIASGRLVALPVDMGLTNGPIGIMTRSEDELSPIARVFRQAAVKAASSMQLW